MDIYERLALVYRRLDEAPRMASAEDALALLRNIVEAVEAEHCSVPKTHPPPLKFDGRMYPPQDDHIRRRADGSLWIKTRRHRIVIGRGGSVVIYHAHRRTIEYRKPGKFE